MGISPSTDKLVVRLKSVARAGVVILLVGAAPASAAPPWSPPAVIGAPPPPRVEANEIDQAVLVPRVSSGKDGAGPQLATWRGAEDSRVLVALNGTSVVRVRTSRAAIASSRYAVSRILHFDASLVSLRGGFKRVQMGYRIGNADLSSFGSSRRIGGPRAIRYTPALAVNEDGAAVAAWHHERSGRSDEIQVTWRPAGGRFSTIRTLQSSGIDDESIVAVGIDSRGRAVVAYSRNRAIAVRVIQTKSGWISTESRAAPPAGQRGPTEITVGTGDPGLVVVAWRAYPVCEGPCGPSDAAASVMRVGSNRLQPAVSLAEGNVTGYPRGPIVAVIDADGRPAVAWGQALAGPARSVPMVAQADNAGVFGPPQALDSAGSVGSMVRQGEGLAVGYLRETPGGEGHGAPLGVFVALRGVSGPFAPGELVDDASSSSSVFDGLQPPGLGGLPSGGLVAVYSDLSLNAQGGQGRVSTRG